MAYWILLVFSLMSSAHGMDYTTSTIQADNNILTAIIKQITTPFFIEFPPSPLPIDSSLDVHEQYSLQHALYVTALMEAKKTLSSIKILNKTYAGKIKETIRSLLQDYPHLFRLPGENILTCFYDENSRQIRPTESKIHTYNFLKHMLCPPTQQEKKVTFFDEWYFRKIFILSKFEIHYNDRTLEKNDQYIFHLTLKCPLSFFAQYVAYDSFTENDNHYKGLDFFHVFASEIHIPARIKSLLFYIQNSGLSECEITYSPFEKDASTRLITIAWIPTSCNMSYLHYFLESCRRLPPHYSLSEEMEALRQKFNEP